MGGSLGGRGLLLRVEPVADPGALGVGRLLTGPLRLLSLLAAVGRLRRAHRVS